MMRVSITRSPWCPFCSDGAPRPRNRNRCPDCVPGGTRTRARPSGVVDLDPRAERRFVHRQRQHDVQVVALTPEPRVGRHLQGDVEIARAGRHEARRAPGPPAAAARRRAPPAGTRSITVSDRACRPMPPHVRHGSTRCTPDPWHRGQARENTMCPRAARSCPVPWHWVHDEPGPRSVPAPAHASQRACRVIVNGRSAPRSASSNCSGSVACRSAPRACRVAVPLAREHLREQVTERALLHGVHARGEVEAFESRRRVRRLRLVTEHVVAAPPLRIAQRFVRFGDLLEPGRRHVVPRVDVGMETAGQLAVRALDVHDRRRARHAEHHVEVHR